MGSDSLAGGVADLRFEGGSKVEVAVLGDVTSEGDSIDAAGDSPGGTPGRCAGDMTGGDK